MMAWLDFIFCALLGWTGVHKFKERNVFLGTLYFLTVGLCGIGWFIDTVRYLIIAIRRTREISFAQSKRLAEDVGLTEVSDTELLERGYGEICYYEQNAACISEESVSAEEKADSLIVFGPEMNPTQEAKGSRRINWSRANELLGRLYVTDKRIVITDGQSAVECPINKIQAVNLYRNLIVFRTGESLVRIATDEAVYVYQITARLYKQFVSG